MDATQIKKIQAMNRYKRRQFLDNLKFYFFTAVTCSLFCCVTLCLPYLSSLVEVIFFAYISSSIPVLLSSKLIFIIGNLIIFVLIVNSRVLSSNPSSTTDVYYDEYIQSGQSKKPQTSTPKVNQGKKLEKHVAVENMVMTVEDGLNSVDFSGKERVNKATDSEAWLAKEEENLDGGDKMSLFSSDNDELNKRADDLIARVNRQRRLELSLLQYGSY